MNAGQCNNFNRRETLANLAALTSLLTVGMGRNAFAGPIKIEAEYWVKHIDELTTSLRGETISLQDWRNGLSEFFRKIDLKDVLKDIDFNTLKTDMVFAERGVSTMKINVGGKVRELSFYPKFFGLNKGRAIIPHGHKNMVSAHMVLGGSFHLRQYDKLQHDEASLLIRPTIDRTIGAGDISTIGDIRDNVHWFIANEPAYTLDVIVSGLDADASKSFYIYNLDIEKAIPENGLLRVPRMNMSAALKKYG